MRVYELTQSGGIDGLRIVERPTPRPGPGQVLVRVHAASLNFRDLLIAKGRYRRGTPKDPLVPLSDGAGVIVEVGPGVRSRKAGDRVAGNFFQKWIDGPFDAGKAESALGGAIDGVLAEYVVFDEGAAVLVPPSLSLEEAATLPCAAVTAWVALFELGGLKTRESIVAMGTGGVSIFALQLAKAAGARVILTSSQDGKLERGKALGADDTINYRTVPAWGDRVRELTGGRGVDHILEVGGDRTLPESLRAVRDGGHICLVGLLGGAPADLVSAQKNPTGIRVDSVFVGSVRHFEAMNDAIEKGRIRPVVDRVFPFEQSREAYRFLERGDHFGKIVIVC
ncbi:MAG TPA: NAD(P)-dependent alcohol dehydrogenase [Polyangiaceae bacterium]|nr:NAD(P)-dependent alcohol dehydrogenase [Polyangiaceae bacterium]